MYLERILTNRYPCYVAVPESLEETVYNHVEYYQNAYSESEDTRKNIFAAGKMYFLKFGDMEQDPIWPVDIWTDQQHDAASIIGYLLADALNGFPVPLYPLSLQKVRLFHESAALGSFDFDILQDMIIDGLRICSWMSQEMLDRYLLLIETSLCSAI